MTIASRLRAFARAMAAIANGENVDEVDVLEYVPEPLRARAAGWVDAGVVTAIHVGYRLKRLSEWLRSEDV